MAAVPNQFVVDPAVPAVRDVRSADAAGRDELTRLAAILTVFAAGLDIGVGFAVPFTVLVVASTVPLWWADVVAFDFSRLLIGLVCVAIPSGLYLAELSSQTREISRLAQLQTIMLLLGGLAVMIAVLWGRAHFPLHLVAVAYGSGDLAHAMLFSSRSWKYHLALPATIVVIGWLGKYRHHLPAILALIALGLVTAVDRGRSFFAFCVLAACLLSWQSLSTASGSRMRRWSPAFILVAAGFVIYDVAVRLLAQGYLGEAARQRTIAQVETSGSLLLGGRPSVLAAVDLLRERPMGYGVGVVPNTEDYAIVTTSFESINLFEHGYIMRYILDGQFRLHSIGADLWIGYGIVGLALALTMGFALIRTLSTLIAAHRCPPLVAVMAIVGVWYLVFEPAYSYGDDVFFALAITLLPRTGAQPGITRTPGR